MDPFALAPEPDRADLVLAQVAADAVDIVVGENLLGQVHQFDQQVRALAPGHEFLDRGPDMIVWGIRPDVEVHVPTDEQMAVADAGMEREPFICQTRLQVADQGSGLLGGDMPGTMVDHPPVGEGHQVAAKDPVIGPQPDALGRCLDGGPSGV